MTLDLDPSSPVPIYQQIVEQVRRLIALEAFRPGERLPTVRELALRCRVNRNTAARAIQELERVGIVETRVGLGTFVAKGARALDARERDAILDAGIDHVVTEAHSLRVPLEQLPARLWRRIDAFRKSGNRGAIPDAQSRGARAPVQEKDR